MTKKSNRSFWRSWRYWGLMLFSVYTLFGFFGLPPIIKTQLIDKTPEYLNRDLAVKEVRFNPLTLALTIKGISLADLDKDVELFGLEELHVNFDSFSLFRWAWTFSEIRFSNPRINLRINEAGEPSFNDLIPPSDDSSSTDTAQNASMPRLVIQQFIFSRGEFKIEDQSVKTPFIQAIDPINFNLVDFSTLPEREGPYQIHVTLPDGGSIHWQGEVSINPIQSEGRLQFNELSLNPAWRYLQDNLRFSLDAGNLSGKLNYHFNMGNSGPEFVAHNMGWSLNDVIIRDKAQEEKSMSLPKVSLTGGQLSLTQQTIRFEEFAIDDGRVDTYLSEDGILHLAELFSPVNPVTAAVEEDNAEAEDSSPWKVELDQFSINNFTVDFIDRSTKPDAKINISEINIIVSDITNQDDDQFGLQANLKLNEEGVIDISGKVAAMPPMADLTLDIKTPPLADFQAYINEITRISLVSGMMSLQGKLQYAESQEAADIVFSGDLEIPDFAINNRLSDEKIASWKNLNVSGMTLALFPDKLDIDSVTLTELKSDISIAKNGEMNIDTLVTIESSSEPFPMTIGSVKLENNVVAFKDSTVTPRFSLHLNQLNGSIKGLSSENGTRADVELLGLVDDYAKLTVNGKVNPLSDVLYTDLKIEFNDYDMTSVTPYTGRYVGNAIDKGKMVFDLSYLVSDNNLVGENKVILDQLTLGNKIESKDAMNLPIGLVIALVKDSKGIIDIDVPVEGNLDDPQFRLSGMIFSALGNVITNIATSPFKMLAKLAGGNEDMDRIQFIPGESVMLAGHDKRIETLSKALKQRPQLLLEIRGQYSLKADKAVLQRKKFLTRLSTDKHVSEKGQELGALNVDIFEKYYVAQDGEEALLAMKAKHTQSVADAPSDAPKIFNAEKYKAALLETLVSSQLVSEGELRDLAISRASVARNKLTVEGGLDGKRIFVLEPGIDEGDKQEGITTYFKLTAK